MDIHLPKRNKEHSLSVLGFGSHVDWILILCVGIAMVIGGASYALYVFFATDKELVSNSPVPSRELLDEDDLVKARMMLEERAQRFEALQETPLYFIDPSL